MYIYIDTWEGGGEGKGEWGGVDSIQTKQKRVAREQRNKYKPRTEQEQHLPIRHAGRPADTQKGDTREHHSNMTRRTTNPFTTNFSRGNVYFLDSEHEATANQNSQLSKLLRGELGRQSAHSCDWSMLIKMSNSDCFDPSRVLHLDLEPYNQLHFLCCLKRNATKFLFFHNPQKLLNIVSVSFQFLEKIVVALTL